MRVVVTGAGGFVGLRLAERLLGLSDLSLALTDTRLGQPPADARVAAVEGDLRDAEVRSRLVGDGVDVVFHLAAVLGGAAEGNYALSRAVNLDASLALVEAAIAAGGRPRVIYSSSIAVFGAKLPDPVTDTTPLKPELTYGAHKLMLEIALADLTRRGVTRP